jgi:hypothetical protein
MREHAVGHRGILGRRQKARCDYAGFFNSAARLDKRQRFPAGEQAASRDHRRDRVEHMMFGFFLHCFGQRLAQCAADVGRQRLHYLRNFKLGLRLLHADCSPRFYVKRM